MRKDKNFACGFTIAEILISLLISAIIATAMVPIIGLKKVRNPLTRTFHGIAECYYAPDSYDEETGEWSNWKLHYFYATRGSNASVSDVEVADSDHCTLSLPEASYYRVITVGAGGNSEGEAWNMGFNYIDDTDLMADGWIRVDSNYFNDISSVTGYKYNSKHKIVKSDITSLMTQLLKTWSSTSPGDLYADYTLRSPIGSGGKANCYAKTLGTSKCVKKCNGADTSKCYKMDGIFHSEEAGEEAIEAMGSSACWFYVHKNGGNSGKGLSLANYRVPLNEKVRIITTTYHETSIEDKNDDVSRKITLTKSGSGGDATADGVGFVSGEDSEENSQCIYTGTDGADYCSKTTVTTSNSGAECGIEGPGVSMSCSKSGTIPGTLGSITYNTTVSSIESSKAEKKDAAGLYWKYVTKQIVPRIIAGGGVGSQQINIYEKLAGTLYMYPGLPGGETPFSYVSTKLLADDPGYHSVISRAESGGNGGETDMPMSLEGLNLPIPTEFIELATPNRSADLSYLSTLMTSGFGNGIINCVLPGMENFQSWCPGYSGNGIYFHFSKEIPQISSLIVTNLFNGKSFEVSPSIETGSSVIVPKLLPKVDTCFDGETVATKDGLNNENFASYVAYDPLWVGGDLIKKYIPKYCQEKKRNGNPGAVIVIW